jgi:hypothetical protein
VIGEQTLTTSQELACPLKRRGKIAGCLWVHQTEDCGFSQARREIVGLYSDLLALAFEGHDLPSQINLQPVSVDTQTQKQIILAYIPHFPPNAIHPEHLHAIEEAILQGGTSYD